MKQAAPSAATPPRVRYFVDTEFVEYGDRVIPVSIGIVSESGREYYAEYDCDWSNYASDWVRQNVVPYLECDVQPPERIRDEIRSFVGDLPCEYWAYFGAWDWVILCRTMGGLRRLPRNWLPFVCDLAWLDPGLERIRAVAAHNPKPHHALWDARELHARYRALTETGNPLRNT